MTSMLKKDGLPLIASVSALLMLSSARVAAGDLVGIWQHESEPVWIQIEPNETVGRVQRNDNKPEAVGFEMIKDLAQAGKDKSSWTGQVYAAKLGEFKSAEIELIDEDVMRFKVKVGFISRSVEWQRVDELPAD